MGTFKSNLQGDINFLDAWQESNVDSSGKRINIKDHVNSIDDKNNYTLSGDPLDPQKGWMGKLINNHINSPEISTLISMNTKLKWTLNLDDDYTSTRDSFIIYNDRSQDYFRHRLNINGYTRQIIEDDNAKYTYIGSDGKQKPQNNVVTSFENEDPVIYGFEIIMDPISSPLLNGAVEDFIGQFSSISEIRSRSQVIFDFKQQFKKLFKTKLNIDFASAPNQALQSSDYDEYAWSETVFNSENRFTYGKKTYLSHYIQKITGLDLLTERNSTEAHKPFSEWPKNKLTLSFYEDVSGTLSALSHLYKLLYWSVPNGKSLIPENLLRFNCDIIISEIRNFKRTIKDGGDIQIVKDNVSRHIYSLKECQFFFNKRPHDETIDLSNTKVYGDGGPGLDVEMNWKYSTVRFEKWISDGGNYGQYVGYDSGTIWKKNGKQVPKFYFNSTNDSLKLRNNDLIIIDKFDNFNGLRKMNQTTVNSNLEKINLPNVNIYDSKNKDYIKFINKYQLVKVESGVSTVTVKDPVSNYQTLSNSNTVVFKNIYETKPKS